METPETQDLQTPAIEPPKRKGCRRAALWSLGIVGALVLGVGIWLGPIIRDFLKAGFFDNIEKREFSGDNVSNLKEMHRAMLLYHESEEMFPYANGWMDAIEPRLQVYDMKDEETHKKLQRSEFWGQPDKYGFAMNASVGGKYKDDVPQDSVLLYSSKSTSRNAFGDPATDGEPSSGESRISVAGNLVKVGGQ